MRSFRSRAAAVALLAVAVTAPTTTFAQAPQAGVDRGYLDFIGSHSGAPRVTSGSKAVATGPYRAKFGATQSLAQGATEFDVFCIDWLSEAGDGTVSTRQPWNVRILTFEEAVTAQTSVAIDLRAKFAAANGGTTGGLTENKLEKVAYIADLMTQQAKPQWNEMHVALWNVLWKSGTTGPFALPGVGGSTNGWRVNDPGDDPNTARFYADAANNAQNLLNFDGSNFRLFVPVKEVKVCASYDRRGRCTAWSYEERFDAHRQVLLGEVVPTLPGVVVPEPAGFALVMTGLAALGAAVRRRQQR